MAPIDLVDLAWSSASQALDPEQGMGDGRLVLKVPGGALLAVVDGVGHGAPAGVAAQSALAALERVGGPDLKGVVETCHDELKATRGATMGLAWLDFGSSSLSWLGIGNVTGVLHRAERGGGERPPLMPQSGGVVGRRLPPLNPAVLPVRGGDRIVIATDGLDARFVHHVPIAFRPEHEVATRLIDDYANHRDDALVLVARCIVRPS